MNIDPTLICAELRAADLLTTLQKAYNGDPHWRREAGDLLHSIRNHILPQQATNRLVEIDCLRRAAEIMEDVADA